MTKHPLRAQIMTLIDNPSVDMHETVDREMLADLLVDLIRNLNDQNQCDFDCDNCHNGGCGNLACERGGCPEDNEKLREEGLL